MGMSAEYDHLAPECREEANLPTVERIRRIQAERWIGYPRAELVLNRLNELLHYPQRDRMPCLLLYAATGMGKTKILRKFRREHPDAFDDRAGVQRMPVVALQMPPEPDEKSFYTQLLASLRAPVRCSMNVHQMRHVVRDLLGYIGTKMLVIDEVHTLLASTYRQQRILLNTLRYLANELRIPLICAGTADARIALTTDPQLADRFEAFELPVWQNDEAFLRLLASFQSVFPLRQRSDLTSAASRRLLLDRTEGVTVRIVRLLETLAVDAIRSGKERIDKGSLEDTRLSPQLLSMSERFDDSVAQ
jgi:type II secretory pathway predicted ATPase ExeA